MGFGDANQGSDGGEGRVDWVGGEGGGFSCRGPLNPNPGHKDL